MLQRLFKRLDLFIDRTLQPRCPPGTLPGNVLRLCLEWNRVGQLFLRRVLKGRFGDAGRVLRNAIWEWLSDHSWRAYQKWIATTEPARDELERQRRDATKWGNPPVFSVVVSQCDIGGSAWNKTLRSLQRQTFPHWIIRRLPAPTATEAAQLNGVLQHATGDYVTFLSAGDVLAPNALYEVANIALRQPGLDVIYSDEDRLRGGRRIKPQFKPDWSPELLLAENYLGALTVVRTQLIKDVDGFHPQVDGAHHWDLLLRVSEHTNKVAHLAKILIHRPEKQTRMVPSPVTKQVISDHMQRRGIPVEIIENPGHGLRLHWATTRRPLVSVIIPNRNQARLLKTCVGGLLQNTDYAPIEIVIVDNRSDEPNVLAYYDRLVHRKLATIVPYDEPFNYSRACNLGANAAQGKMLLFLNNDVEVLHADWLHELTAWANRPQTGVVGAKLLYPNRRIQHAGMILNGPERATAHVFRYLRERSDTIFGSTEVYRNFLAVTGACQMLRRDVFDEVGGYDENYRLCCSDMAICLQAIRRGYRIVYTPHARLIHHESASRGSIDPNEQADLRRLTQLLDEMNIRSDPYFHPALALVNSPPELTLRTRAA